MHSTPLILSEVAARTCYDSFDKSEEAPVRDFKRNACEFSSDIEESALLHELVNVFHHGSIAEHINFTFSIEGMSRGVLQEFARTRIAGLSVKSTRYTGSTVLNVFNACKLNSEYFEAMLPDELFTVRGSALKLEKHSLFDKLHLQFSELGEEEWLKLTTTSTQREVLKTWEDAPEWVEAAVFNNLQATKQKRNAYDPFKWTVTDMWACDLVWTINARSLKNFLKLRDSGAAWFMIQVLAQEVKRSIPVKYHNILWKTNQKEK